MRMINYNIIRCRGEAVTRPPTTPKSVGASRRLARTRNCIEIIARNRQGGINANY